MNRLRTATALFAVALFGASLAVTAIGSASAADSASVSVFDASLTWGLSSEHDSGSFSSGTGRCCTVAIAFSGTCPPPAVGR